MNYSDKLTQVNKIQGDITTIQDKVNTLEAKFGTIIQSNLTSLWDQIMNLQLNLNTASNNCLLLGWLKILSQPCTDLHCPSYSTFPEKWP